MSFLAENPQQEQVGILKIYLLPYEDSIRQVFYIAIDESIYRYFSDLLTA